MSDADVPRMFVEAANDAGSGVYVRSRRRT